MADPVECEIIIAMNQDGLWIVSEDNGDDVLAELMSEYSTDVARVVKVTVHMTPPRMQQALITIPDEAGETITATAE